MNRLLVLGFAAALLTGAAEAKVYRVLTFNNGTDIPAANAVDVKLNASGATSTSFRLSRSGRVAISFSATCANFGDAGWVQIDILVDNIALPPTNQLDDPFCRNGGAEFRSITVGAKLLAGKHTLKIRAQGMSGSTDGEIYDTSLVIFD